MKKSKPSNAPLSLIKDEKSTSVHAPTTKEELDTNSELIDFVGGAADDNATHNTRFDSSKFDKNQKDTKESSP